MSTGPSNVTTTQTSSPPSFLIPGITSAANASLSQSGLGGFQQPQLTQPLTKRQLKQQRRLQKQSRKLGIPFVPNLPQFTSPSQSGLPVDTVGSGVLNEPLTNGNPAAGLLDQSANLVSDTLSGDFLDPSSNPFLASTFNRAADLTQTRLASEFARSGRDLDASLPARSQELQTLAANIFGPNFQAERDRQVGAVSQAQGLDPLNQLINRLAGITPGAGGVVTSQQPVFRDSLGSTLGGAASLLSLI